MKQDKSPKATRAVIVNCWHDSNKGDSAITIGTLNALKAAAVACSYTLVSYMYQEDAGLAAFAFRHVLSEHPDIDIAQPTVPALIRSVGKKRAILMALRGLLKLVFPKSIADDPMEANIRDARVVIANGGLYFGFVNASYLDTLYHLFAFSYPMLFACRVGVSYVLYAQSFGPFHNWLTRRWMRMLFARSSGNWSREGISHAYITRLGAPAQKSHPVADAAFGVRPSEKWPDSLKNYDLSCGYVAMSVRQLDGPGHAKESENRYYASIAAAIERLVRERGLCVLLVAHTMGPVRDEDDRIANHKVYGLLAENVKAYVFSLEDDFSPSDLALIYGRAHAVVATRFHAVLLALIGGAPVIAIPYFGTKTQGYFKDLGLEHMLLEVKDITPDLLSEKIAWCIENEDGLRKQVLALTGREVAKAMQTARETAVIASGRSAETPAFPARS